MNSYDKIMWSKIIIPFREVLIDLPEKSDEPSLGYLGKLG